MHWNIRYQLLLKLGAEFQCKTHMGLPMPEHFPSSLSFHLFPRFPVLLQVPVKICPMETNFQFFSNSTTTNSICVFFFFQQLKLSYKFHSSAFFHWLIVIYLICCPAGWSFLYYVLHGNKVEHLSQIRPIIMLHPCWNSCWCKDGH